MYSKKVVSKLLLAVVIPLYFSLFVHGSGNATQDAVELLEKSMNATIPACDDFYGRACGNYAKHFTKTPLDQIDFANREQLAKRIKQLNDSEPDPVQKVKHFYEKCVASSGKVPKPDLENLLQLISKLETSTNIFFPALHEGNSSSTSPVQMGTIIGKIMNILFKGPLGEDGQLINFFPLFDVSIGSAPTADDPAYSLLFTPPDNFKYVLHLIQQAKVIEMALDEFFTALRASKHEKVSKEVERQTAEDVSVMVQEVVTKLVAFPGDTTDHTAAEANTKVPHLDWKMLLKELVDGAPENIVEEVQKDGFKFRMAGKHMAALETLLGDTNQRAMANLIYFSLIMEWAIERNRINLSFLPGGKNFTNVEIHCTAVAQRHLSEPVDRVFVLDQLRTDEDRSKLQQEVGKIVKYVLQGLRSMVDQVTWLTPKSRATAYRKLDNVVVDLVYSDVIKDVQQLTEIYKPLNISKDSSFNDMMQGAQTLAFHRELSKLLLENRTRHGLYLQPRLSSLLVNAWYIPQQNSITIPLAILRRPFFDMDWPMEWNFGAIGMVIGHELSHGYDFSGVHFDENGFVNTWLDPPAQKAFNEMNECLIKEYDQFCLLPKTEYPRCINGRKTVGENLADNAGIHAAFRGYQQYIDTVGKEEAFPDSKIYGKLQPNQLFFLAFVQPWCTLPIPKEEVKARLIDDPHSPAQFRPRGALPNFPGFKNAFDCGSNTTYAPKEHCNVWISELMHEQYMRGFYN